MVIAVVSLVLSVLAIAISLSAAYYSKRQTEIMEGQESRREREEESLRAWAQKFDEAVSYVLKIGPSWIHRPTGQTNAYGVVCPKPELRQRIETYLVNRQGDHFSARQTSSDILRMPIAQRTITQVLECVERFKGEDPGNANKLGL
jgi:hypothetical protein